jgi:hypothetical protein
MRALVSLLVVFVVFSLVPGAASAQWTNVRVSTPGSYDPEEVVISINPTNPLNLAAGANTSYYYYSMDGGYTWTQGNLTSSYGV